MDLSDVSKYFNKSSLDQIVVKAGGVHHISYDFGDGFSKGDSYLSTVSRLAITGVDSNGATIEVNVIIKSMPKNLARRKLFRSTDFFSNEINFYTKVLPVLDAFQKQCNPEEPFTEFPRVFLSHTDGENDFIVLENINFLGYVAPVRLDYISLEQVKLTLRTLGRFHALSLAFRTKEPKKFEELTQHLTEVYYNEKFRVWYIDFLGDAMNVAKYAIHDCYPNGDLQTITDKFLANSNQLFDDMTKMVTDRTKYTAIGHGDCWTPNFLTKFENGDKPVAIKMIDFQLARCSSFAIDLSFFLYSCTSDSLRVKHYSDLLQSYHKGASELLTQLGCDAEEVFPYDGMLEELTNYGRFGCGMGIESIPMSVLEEDEIADLDSIESTNVLTDIWKLSPFQEKAKNQRIADMFKHAVSEGFIK